MTSKTILNETISFVQNDNLQDRVKDFFEAKSSAFHPFGPAAEMIDDLHWGMVYGFGAIFILVLVLTIMSLLSKRWQKIPRPPLGDSMFIMIGGLILPLLVLFPLLIETLFVTKELQPKKDSMVIRLTGHMWWWEVEYPDHGIISANELIIPAGVPIKLEMTSADVIHSFWAPSLSGKTDLIPGQKTYHWLEASKVGSYRAQCAEFCGLQHARMALLVIAKEPKEFEDWVKARVSPPPPPTEGVLAQGLNAFMESGCAECHSIRGTAARGKIGPDLTHIGSRSSLGAGVLPNTFGSLAGWVANPQALKPGNKMPASYIKAEDYHPLITYLMGLE